MATHLRRHLFPSLMDITYQSLFIKQITTGTIEAI